MIVLQLPSVFRYLDLKHGWLSDRLGKRLAKASHKIFAGDS